MGAKAKHDENLEDLSAVVEAELLDIQELPLDQRAEKFQSVLERLRNELELSDPTH